VLKKTEKAENIDERIEIPEILSAKSDYIFKLIFGDERNKDILEDLLRSMLDLPDEEYEVLEIVDPHIKRTTIDSKLAILDIKIKTKSGNIVNIEIQLINTKQIKERVIFYLSGLVNSQIKSGEDYNVIKKTICIVISDFEFLPHEKCFDLYKLYSTKTDTEFSDILQIVTLEIPKIAKDPENSQKWLWGKFLTVESKEELDMVAKTSPAIAKAAGILERLSQRKEIREEYEARERAVRDYKMYINDARQDGIIIGEARGITIGEARGINKEKVRMAKQLLSFGVDAETVAKSAKLSVEEVKSL
jgi:predicted transposase/invertase (TIGR01784 family)